MSRAPITTGFIADVVIVGGGVIGLTIARALCLRSVGRVILVEKSEFGREASWAAGGILAPQVEADQNDDFFSLACASRDLYPEFARGLRAETGVDVELDTTGTLYVAFNDHDEAELRRRLAWQQGERLRVEWLTGAEARRLEPCLSQSVRCALRFPDDHQVENRKLIEALILADRKQGVQLLDHCEALRLVLETDKVTGMETSRGFIASRNVVVAAGAWSSIMDQPEAIAVKPIRGQMLCFRTEPQFARHVIYSSRGYLIPRRDARLLAGSTSESVGFDKAVTNEGLNEIKSMALEIAPAVSSLELLDSWAGFRPRAADGLPVIGSSQSVSGLFYATGHFRNGILLAPITGELIAAAISTETIPPMLKAFLPNRFSTHAN